MKKLEFFELKNENGKKIIDLGQNRNVTSVTLTTKGDVKVYYAQNSIITDLIEFGTNKICENKVICSADKPRLASHIFIECDGKIEKAEVLETEIGGNYLYPCYFDFDLKENYYLDDITVFLDTDGFCHYSIFTSLNGRDFSLVCRKTDNAVADKEKGIIHKVNGTEARYIRLYFEYNSVAGEACLSDLKYSGKKSGTPLIPTPEVNVSNFADSEFAAEITEEDTYNEVYGIIKRRLGEEYLHWFVFELAPNPTGKIYDYFKITVQNGKVKISANQGVNLCAGLNYYLKNYCGVAISQVGDQAEMPQNIVLPQIDVYKETKAKERYSYNYCTLSYTMAFWGEDEWRRELDWLALNGVNLVLDITGLEEVWRRFLKSLGYTHGEIKKFIAGPGYYAWAYMANLTGFLGPVHDSWFYDRTALARKNHRIMRTLGMRPVLQGYSGMVPCDILLHDSKAEIVPQGTWGAFQRPHMLRTTSPCFKKYAALFYKAQKEVYGPYSHYYATDPFHEGGIVADLKPREIAVCVLNSMLEFDKDAVWVIQSWQQNPTSELLAGIGEVENGRDHALILDLWADKNPNYKNGSEGRHAHGYSPEFDSTPWVFCMLSNFGGRLGAYGELSKLAKELPLAFNNAKCIKGIGITPEATENNPLMYDFFFESIWRDDADGIMPDFDLNKWVEAYADRRSGTINLNVRNAFKTFIKTAYNGGIHEGSPECVINARPALEIKKASTWGGCTVTYDKTEFKEGVRLLLKDFDKLKDSPAYIYDCVTFLQQVLSNDAQDCHQRLIEAYRNKDLPTFNKEADCILNIIDNMEKVTANSPYYRLDRWINYARNLGKNADEFSRWLYELNARTLITTWGGYYECEVGELHDYSNRQWSGILGDYCKKRWVKFIGELRNELEGKPFISDYSWFEFEWAWARGLTEECALTKKTDLSKLNIL